MEPIEFSTTSENVTIDKTTSSWGIDSNVSYYQPEDIILGHGNHTTPVL